MAKIPLNGWTKEKRWVPRKKEFRHVGRYDTEIEAAHVYNLEVLAQSDNEYEYLNEVPI